MAYFAYYVPNGPRNLTGIFPDIDFSKVVSYEIVVNSIASTTSELDGDCCTDKVRVYFQNALGGIDAINFCLVTEEFETKSDSFVRRLPTDFAKRDSGRKRFGVKANDFLNLTNVEYTEDDREWLKELLESSNVWIDMPPDQGQNWDYVPVIVTDGRFIVKKEADRYVLEFSIQVSKANERIVQRN